MARAGSNKWLRAHVLLRRRLHARDKQDGEEYNNSVTDNDAISPRRRYFPMKVSETGGPPLQSPLGP